MMDPLLWEACQMFLYICIYTSRDRRRRVNTGGNLDRVDLDLFISSWEVRSEASANDTNAMLSRVAGL
jgi:hypothetical protein